MMKPILFSTPMVQAILREVGPKTMTRRVIKPPKHMDGIYEMLVGGFRAGVSEPEKIKTLIDRGLIKPRYQPGDVIWVRETWCNINKPGIDPDYYYLADAVQAEDYYRPDWKWKPSIHMPKEAARIFLRMIGVRVERLQDITEADAKAEGVLPVTTPDIPGKGRSYIQGFGELWNRLNAKRGYGWDTNPWVWVYEFERCEKPEDEKK